ncbi:MAG TPA: DUF4430 domain-containing protein [Solirubrobacterales bacterium]|nr:DUF4430 domain-containing protein [Solirubrobacterales bacterium]
MTRRRGTAVVGALLAAALAAAGCGLGPGADVGSVQLTVTREYGAVPVLERSVGAKESDTVMRLLEGQAEVATRYGGGYVHSINGVAEAQRGGDPYDWFFYVDGVESPVGAAEVDVHDGERIWWDYRDWAATNHVPAVVGSWPAPFVHGVGGKAYPVAVECEGGGGACEATRAALEREGVKLASGSPKGAIRVLVGTWDRLRSDPAAQLIEAGPAESGVYAHFAGVRPFRGMEHEKTNAAYELVALDQDGAEAKRLGPDAGLVAATSRYGGAPIWLVTGGTPAAVRSAADSLEVKPLRDHYAIAVKGSQVYPLPQEKP